MLRAMQTSLNLTGAALTPGAQRSWWLREALAHDPGRPCPALSGDVNADVVIVGGGFTGLWTAYFLTERNPDLAMVVLEQDICGGGPRGRNSGLSRGWGGGPRGPVTPVSPKTGAQGLRAPSSPTRRTCARSA